MRRVNVTYGLLERMNDLLGNSFGANNTEDTITPWSIQGVLLENLSRIAIGLAGSDGKGRIGSGLTLSKNGNKYDISPGIGFTQSGEILKLSDKVSVSLSPGEVWFTYKTYLDTVNGHESNVTTNIGNTTATTIQIVHDNLSDSTTISNSAEGNDSIFLGTIESDGTVTLPNIGFGKELAEEGLVTTEKIVTGGTVGENGLEVLNSSGNVVTSIDNSGTIETDSLKTNAHSELKSVTIGTPGDTTPSTTIYGGMSIQGDMVADTSDAIFANIEAVNKVATQNIDISGTTKSGSYTVGTKPGITDTFKVSYGTEHKKITVTGGLITEIAVIAAP